MITIDCVDHILKYFDGKVNRLEQENTVYVGKLRNADVKCEEEKILYKERIDKQLDNLKTKIKALEVDNENLKNQNMCLTEEMTAFTKRFDEYKIYSSQSLQNTRAKNDSKWESNVLNLTQAHKIHLKTLTKSLNSLKSSSKSHITSIYETCESHIQDITSSLSSTIASLTTHTDTLSSHLNDLKSKISAKVSQIADILTTNANKCHNLTSTIEHLTVRLSSMHADHAAMQAQTASRQAAVDSLEHDLREASRRWHAEKAMWIEREAARVREEAYGKMEEMRFEMEADKGKQIEYIVERLAREKDEIVNSCNSQVEAIQRELSKQRVHYESEISSLRTQLNSTKESYEESFARQQATLKALESQNTNLKSKVLSQLNEELSVKANMISSQNTRIGYLSKKLNETEQSLSSVAEKLATVASENKRLREDSQTREQEISEAIAEVESRCRKLIDLRDKAIESLRYEVDKLRSIIDNEIVM